MNDNHVAYYAIIPANVRYDKDLSPNAKLLYGEITALSNMKGYCWASNNYFAELYGVSKVSISKWVKQLLDKGYINSEMKYKDGTKEIEFRYLTIVNTPLKNVEDPIKEKFNTPIKEKFKDNNTLINNTINKDINKSSVTKVTKPKRIFEDDSYEMLMVKFFITEMKNQGGLFRAPNESQIQTWCNDVRLIIQNDLKVLHEDENERWKTLKELVIHSCRKPFFSQNIRSIGKLRKRIEEVHADLINSHNKQNKLTYNNYNTLQQQQTTTHADVNIEDLYK